MTKTLLMVGIDRLEALENSYRRAFMSLGWQVEFWNLAPAWQRAVRGGRLGLYVSQFIRVDPWLRKANRELVLHALALQPDLILTFTHTQVMPGALAQIRASTDARLVQIWPDPLLSWEANLSANLPLYDLVATYSRETQSTFERMGARRVAWIPLAGDPELHPLTKCTEAERKMLGADVTFIGGWRPERETILTQLRDFDLKIWGPDWGRRCKSNAGIMKAWQGRPLCGLDFARAVQASKTNLNIIDPTNHAAANMRFFEIPTAGGLQVSSACPEMEREFRHGEHVFYFSNTDHLKVLLEDLLADDATRNRAAQAAHQKVLSAHTYLHRTRSILEEVQA
jgi:spore maturation protein CgeB